MKHLEMIQTTVSRMANNSFLIKGWSVTLVAALFALAAKDSEQNYVYISYLPVVMFWSLDGYFLNQEKLFRKLYDSVRVNTQTDFSMNTLPFAKSCKWMDTAFSQTLLLFHGAILLTVCIVMFFLKNTGVANG